MPKWMTVKDLAAYIQVSPEAIYKLAQRRRIPASKVLSQWRFEKSEIDNWMKKQRPRKTKV